METGRRNGIVIFLVILITSFFGESVASMYNVVAYGANPGGSVDSTTGFISAWGAACGSTIPAKVYVPPGRFLITQKASFRGPCSNKAISFIIDGVLLAPSDYRVMGHFDRWISFESVDGVSINGGILDGQGTSLWACKTTSGRDCPAGATTLRILNSSNVFMTWVTSMNSQMFHIVINGCSNVKLEAVKIRAPENSPNTDGIHVQSSSYISILNSRISTGDDCISIGPGTNNLWIENVVCGPGHGISIGSLGKDFEEAGVQNVTVTTSTFMDTENGVRIKTWGRPSNGFVNGVVFQHATMINVKNPIVIDQNYCPYSKNCPDQSSGVKISNVTYEDIHGSSATQVAVKFDCSSKNPCSGIKLGDVMLSYRSEQPKSSCANADGTSTGQIQPACCLYS